MPAAFTADYDVVLVEGILLDGSKCWTALHPQLPGCNATGRGAEEALQNLEMSREAWLAIATKLGEPLPAGSENPVFTTTYLPVPGATRVTTPATVESQLVPSA